MCSISYSIWYEGGVARLKQLDYRGQPSRLNAHAASVEAYFREHPPHIDQEMVPRDIKG